MASAAAARAVGSGALRRREARTGLLFVLPWLLSLLVFTAYPVLGTLGLSFTDYNIVSSPHWVGLANFRRMLGSDPDFWLAAKNSAWYAAVSVPLRLLLALALALLLNAGVRGIGIYRALFYLPALVPPVAATIVFMLMLNPNAGPLDATLRAFGLPGPDWLRDPSWARWALVLISLWPLGVEVLVFLAGLQEIPQDLLDAAALDGAGGVRRFAGITVPLLSPVILFNLVVGVIYSFQVFAPAIVLGGTTGEPLKSTLMYMVLIYRNAFRYFAMGYAAAQALALFVVVALLTLLIFRTARRWVYYEGGA